MHKIQNTKKKFKIQNTKYKTQNTNTNYKIQNAKRKIQNTKYKIVDIINSLFLTRIKLQIILMHSTSLPVKA